jgi:hypothetical protein
MTFIDTGKPKTIKQLRLDLPCRLAALAEDVRRPVPVFNTV